jgi:hypothetical protein
LEWNTGEKVQSVSDGHRSHDSLGLRHVTLVEEVKDVS